MFPKDRRVNLSKDFKWVASGSMFRGTYFKLFVKMGENKEARVGVAVSGRVFKKAVDRSRAKRIVYQSFGKLYQALPPGINIVALPNARVLDVKSEELDREVGRLLPKILSLK